jgi:rhodanese-related sulfurtransferase
MYKSFRSSGLILFIFLIFLVGCSQSQSNQDTRSLSPTQVKHLIDNAANIVIIDVRTPQEYDGELGHIEGAILRPVQEIDQWTPEFEKNKNQEIIMVCRTGNRSGYATKYFHDKGFKNVYNMTGGMKAWNKDGLPVTRQNGEGAGK